jgi:hypothetical protein
MLGLAAAAFGQETASAPASAPTTAKVTTAPATATTKAATTQVPPPPLSSPAPNYKDVSRVAWVVGFHETGETAAGPFLKQQLGSAITQMRMSRYLSIVMVTDVVVDVTPKGGYIRALGDDKTNVLQKIEGSKQTGDRTKEAPYLDALKKVFALSNPPELIYLMVDSPLSNETAEAINALNKGETFITVFAVLPAADADLEPLKKIAEANRGKFKILSEKDISPAAAATATSATAPSTTATLPSTTTAPATAK